MLPTPMPCSMLASTSTSDTSFSAVGVAILRLDQIHDRLGQRAIVANAAGQHVVDAAALTHSYMIPDVNDALLDGLADAARPAHGVDGAHVMVVPALDRPSRFEVDAERRAEHRELDVVDGQRVARQQHLHVAGANELGEIRRAAGVDDDGPDDHRDLPAVGPDAPHHLGDAR